ncbi:TPA: DUF968 domain-containing protein [Escherichia coli]|nr:DUF968 domain-containing protein [Escherichia coli]HBN0626337.1 DUF968 domain-containing protein [Escherichia coli]HBN0681483.1 DUF968 domain-containing protein [Escherichia coli]HBN0710713.1 DUF968 domain-containing protein [Escherichia coli]
MRVLLRPVPVPELGLVVLKPGRESMQVFHNPRVLVEPEPKSMRGLPSGVVPAVRQPLAEDKSLLPFFSNERVIRAAGGAGALSDWLLRHIKSCQWPHGDYHHSETVIHRYGTGAMVLCWHCDNQLRNQTSESLGQLAHQNLSAWMIDVIRHAMNGTQERELSLAELCCWASVNDVVDAMTENMARRILKLPGEKIRSVYRESDIVPGEQTAISILKQRTKNIAPLPHAHQQQNPPQEKTVVSIAVDPESPAQYLQRQKPQREEMPVYTRWVKTQKCMTCGNQADDPHHIIGHGLGGMGTKADDLFVIPLCRKCHRGHHRLRRFSAWGAE